MKPPSQILTPFPRLPNWYRSNVPHVALSVCIGADCIWLAAIDVECDYRGQGIGTVVVNELKAMADRLGLPIHLTPVSEEPQWQHRLEGWYEGLGFAWEGETMVYQPVPICATDAYLYAPGGIPIRARVLPNTRAKASCRRVFSGCTQPTKLTPLKNAL